MTAQLRALFAFLGVVAVGGGAYSLLILKPQYTPGDAIDAGLLSITQAARLQCQVRVKEACRIFPDGGPPRYVTLQFKARISLPDASTPFVVFDVPNAWQDCIVPVGTPAEACTVLENGACTVPAVCNANAQPQFQAFACACSSGATCKRLDGGTQPLGVTLAAGSFTGAGCLSKYCGPEIAGEQGQSWPQGCPQ